MAKPFESHTYNIGHLLGRYEQRPLVIPSFQRGFSWEKSHVSAFLNDFFTLFDVLLINNKKASHFLGLIVIQENDENIIILDGQQRIATATILLAVIRDLASELDPASGKAGFLLARDIQRDLILKEEEPLQYALTLGELDSFFFAQTIQKQPRSCAKPVLHSHQLIADAYNYFAKELRRKIEVVDSDAALSILEAYKDCLTKGMKMVSISVESEDDTFAIFETLNDRGLPISVPDRLLNLLMRRCDNKDQRNSVRHHWNRMLQQMGRKNISDFIRNMWVSKNGDLKKKDLFAEIKEHLQKESIESTKFAATCAEECDDYIAIMEYSKGVLGDATDNVYGLVKQLRVYSSLPLLLSGLRCLEPSDFTKLAEAAVALVIRHSIMLNLNPTDLEKTLYSAAREISSQHAAGSSSRKCFQAACKILADRNPDDSVVMANAGNVVLGGSGAKWLITKIANHMLSKTNEIINSETVSLEHIFPQNPDGKWPNREAMRPYIWNLGNLTILGKKLNTQAANEDFALKRAKVYQKSTVEMTRRIPSQSKWTPAEVEKRARKLAKEMIMIWPGPKSVVPPK